MLFITSVAGGVGGVLCCCSACGSGPQRSLRLDGVSGKPSPAGHRLVPGWASSGPGCGDVHPSPHGLLDVRVLFCGFGAEAAWLVAVGASAI